MAKTRTKTSNNGDTIDQAAAQAYIKDLLEGTASPANRYEWHVLGQLKQAQGQFAEVQAKLGETEQALAQLRHRSVELNTVITQSAGTLIDWRFRSNVGDGDSSPGD